MSESVSADWMELDDEEVGEEAPDRFTAELP